MKLWNTLKARTSAGAHIFAVLLLLASINTIAHAAPSDSMLISVNLSPDNTFDNRQTAVGSDSGVYINLTLVGSAAANENPDSNGAYRMSIFDGNGALVRRLASQEINSNPTSKIWWNGHGANAANDTLDYGAYTLRTLVSMKNPTISGRIQGSGIVVSRPGDMHVTAAGVLTWVNTSGYISFCQVSLGDPATQEPTFLRLVALPTGYGSANTNKAYGVVMNSQNQVFVTDNYNNGAAGCRIGKYDTATDSWVNENWATNATSAVLEDEWAGLGIDSADSIFVACGTAISGMGGGNGGSFEGVMKFRDIGNSAAVDIFDSAGLDMGTDNYDVAPLPRFQDHVYVGEYGSDAIIRHGQTFTGSLGGLRDFGTGTYMRGVAATKNGAFAYVTRPRSVASTNVAFAKVNTITTNIVYSLIDAKSCTGARGITVWQKTATNETFVIVAFDSRPSGRGPNGQIRIYKENAAGDSASFVRVISCTGLGDTVDRPGDMHVDSNGILYWVNTGDSLSFCRANLNDPNIDNPTMLKQVSLPPGMGSTNTLRAYGIAVNGSNDVFISDNQYSGSGDCRIAKYSINDDTWVNYNWVTSDSTVIAEDEFVGLGIDANGDVYVSCGTDVVDVDTGSNIGSEGAWEGTIRFRDKGYFGEPLAWTGDDGQDNFDVAPVCEGDSVRYYFFSDPAADQLEYNYLLGLGTQVTDPWRDLGGATTMKSIDIAEDYYGGIHGMYVARGNTIVKLNNMGSTVYTLTGDGINTATGVAVWQKAATGETFVIVASQGNNQIHIFKENAAGDTALFVRSIEEDNYTLTNPEGLAADPTGEYFYVVSRGSRAIKKFTKNGIFEPMLDAYNSKYIQGLDITNDLTDSSGFNTPRAIACDTDGNIYVFDHKAAYDTCVIKKFSSSGRPLGVIFTLQSQGWSGIINQPVVQATYASGSIYGVTSENGARLLRISTAGVLLGHLGTYTAAFGADAAEGAPGGDVLSVQVAPFFDDNNTFYSEALYLFERGNAGNRNRVEVWKTDLSGTVDAVKTLTLTEYTAPSADNVVSYLVDEFGDMYFMNDGTAAGGVYYFRKWNAADSVPNDVGTAFATNAYLEYPIFQGSTTDRLNAPREMIWADGRGRYDYNALTGKYEQRLWVCDQNNNRIQQMTLQWNDANNSDITIALGSDTPSVISASISGDSVIAINGVYYAGAGNCTIQVNFNKAMMTAAAPDTMTVQYRPSGGSFVSFNKISYTSATWKGTSTITPAMQDGEAQIKVENAYDNDGGQFQWLYPNPDQTDFDLTDFFRPIIIDKTAPTYSITTPAASGDTTSDAFYTVSGQILTEATGLDATIVITCWSDSVAGAAFDQRTVLGNASTGNFSTNINLRYPAPTENWIEIKLVDKLGNNVTVSPRRKVYRQRKLGTAEILPSSEIGVATLRRYEITYTAGMTLTGDTIRVTIPNSWSVPQKTDGWTNGYVTLTSQGTFGDSVFNGQEFTIYDVAMSIGQKMVIAYGDTAASPSGASQTTVDAPLDDASNTFEVEGWLIGDTSWTGIYSGNGTLTVPVKDSDAGISVTETYPGGSIPKGDTVKPLVLRLYNYNTGNHANRVTSLQLRLESETGGALGWQNYISKVEMKNITEGVTFATVTSFPTTQDLTINPTNYTAFQGGTRDASFFVTILPTAPTDTVRIYFKDSTVFSIVDDATGKVLGKIEANNGVYYQKSGTIGIYGQSPADTCYIGADTSITPLDVSVSQKDVRVLDLIFRNPSQGAETPVNTIRVDRLYVTMLDGSGNPLIPSQIVKGMSLSQTAGIVTFGGLDTPNIPSSGSVIDMPLSGLTIASDGILSTRLWISLVDDTVTVSSFKVRIADSSSFVVKDNVTVAAIPVYDDPLRSDRMSFQSNTITVQRIPEATMNNIRYLRTDSTVIDGLMGDQIVVGEQFLVRVAWTNATGKSAMMVIPSDTDLRLKIDGVDRTNQFTISAPASKAIASGSTDTFYYAVIQNLGSDTGSMQCEIADTTTDTRPRLFDNHDYNVPDVLRAKLLMPVLTCTAAVTNAPFDASVFTIDTSYAGAKESNVVILKFQVKNNLSSPKNIDSIVISGLNTTSKISQVKLYHDNENGVFSTTNDTLVAVGTLSAGACTLVLTTAAPMASYGGRETFFVAFDMETTLTDGDTFDAQVDANGIWVSGQSPFPATPLNSSGKGLVEVVATRLTMTPDTQLVAVSATTNVTLKAVDTYANVDNLKNTRSAVQGYQAQVNFSTLDGDSDASQTITATSGMNSVVPVPGAGVTAINGFLSSGQGQVSFTDNEAETLAITVTSVLQLCTGMSEFANLLSITAATITSTTVIRPDSRAITALAIRIVNQSGANDQLNRIGVRSLNTADTCVTAVLLFRDINSNGKIDSGTDELLGTSNFTNGFVDFNFLTTGVLDQDSEIIMVGYNIATNLVDWLTLDCKAETVTMASSTRNYAAVHLNSTPHCAVDIQAIRLSMNPTSGTIATGERYPVIVAAVDTYNNADKDYTGGGVKCSFDLTVLGQFDATMTNLANEEYPVAGDYTQIRGNLTQGQAILYVYDLSAETITLTVIGQPDLGGTSDTGVYVVTQGFFATALNHTSSYTEPGDTDRVAIKFRASAVGASDTVTQVKINWIGTRTPDVTNLRLYYDANGDELFTAGTDVLYDAAQPFVAETVTFNGSRYIPTGTSKAFFLVVDVESNSIGGDTLDAQVLVTSITTTLGIYNVPSGILNSAGVETIARVPDTFGIGYTSLGNRNASEDQDEIVPMTFTLTSAPYPLDRKFYLETLALRVDGLLGGKVPSTVISQAKLRHSSGSPTYVTKTSIESSGDSLVFTIPFDSNLSFGGTTPETITLQLVLKIPSSVTHNDTFRITLLDVDSRFVKIYDHPTGIAARSNLRTKYTYLSGSAAPMRSGIITVQNKAIVTQQSITLTDVSNVPITSVVAGVAFRVHVNLKATTGRAGAMVRSSDTDLTFKRANGTVDITNEFTVTSRSHTVNTDIAAGAEDTVTYDVVQISPFSGSGETLVVNNLLSPDTGPYLFDKNSQTDATKLRIYAAEVATSTGAIRIDPAYAYVSTDTLSAKLIAPDSRGVVMLNIKVLDGSSYDTLRVVTVRRVTGTAANIRAAWVVLDQNKSGTFDSGVDPRFGTQQNFLASDTLTFNGSYVMAGSGDTIGIFFVIDFETSPVTDSVQFKFEIPYNGLGFQNQDSLPKSIMSNTAYHRTRIIATRLSVTPDTQVISIGTNATFNIEAIDTWSNRNVYATNWSQALIVALINDTPGSLSSRWVSTDFNNQVPLALPTAEYYDTRIQGNIYAGIGSAVMIDTAVETVSVAFTNPSIIGDTVIVRYVSEPAITAVSLPNSMKLAPDSDNAQILTIDIAYPQVGTAIDSIWVRSENTADTCMKRVRLWFDNGDNVFNATTDSCVDTKVWSNNRCSFLVGKQYYKDTAVLTVRAFVTAQMETYPQVDNDSVGARIEIGCMRMQPGGLYPSSQELDSIGSDTLNALIDIDAIHTGGAMRFVNPGDQYQDIPFVMTIRAEDKYGNYDKNFTTLGSSAGKTITFSASPAVATCQATSMTQDPAGQLPAATFTGRFVNYEDTITVVMTAPATPVTITADIATSPPSDTTVSFNVSNVIWNHVNQPMIDSQAIPGETALVAGKFRLRYLAPSRDSVIGITVRNVGNVRCTDIVRVGVFFDAQNNGVFDTGVDTRFGSWGAFSSGETAYFVGDTLSWGFNDSKVMFVVYDIKPLASILAANGDTIACRFDTDDIATEVFSGDVPTAIVNASDSIRLIVLTGDVFADSKSLGDATFGAGTLDVPLGRFLINNTRPTLDTVTSITVKNYGTHPDTGLNNIRIVFDGNKNGVYDVGVDTIYGSATTFTNGSLTIASTQLLGINSDSNDFLVIADIDSTRCVDSATLAVRVETGHIVTVYPDTAAEFPLWTLGTRRIVFALGAGDSCMVAAGEAPVYDTLWVSVSIRDTLGNAMSGRVVQLGIVDAGPSILTTNPMVTDTSGTALFGITSATAGTFRCTSLVSGSVYPASIGYATFLSSLNLIDTGFTNNTSRSINASAGAKLYSSPLSFSRTTADRAAELRYNGLDYSIYYDHINAPAVKWNLNDAANITLSNPAPDWTSSAKVRTLKGVGNDNIVFGGYSNAGNYGVNLYYKTWAAAAGVAPTRISPNDTRTGTANLHFDTDAEFGQFDVHPSGETVVFAFSGNLARFHATGASFDPVADSPTMKLMTTLVDETGNVLGGYQASGPWVAYPEYSPDGNRIAMTIIRRAAGWDGSTGTSDSAEIYVLKNLTSITPGNFPWSNYSTCSALTNSQFVRVTARESLRFAWQPHWSRDGNVIFFSANSSSAFNYDQFSQTEFPENAFAAAGVDFDGYMIYYDPVTETAPYGPIKVTRESNVNELLGEISFDGTYLAYMRNTKSFFYQNRTLTTSNSASVNSNGGILFDSGRVIVVIRPSDAYGTGFEISSSRPESSPAGKDSVIITGMAKMFFNPDTPTSPVYFVDSVIVYLYYDANNFTDTERIGFDSDGDGIPDRTEAAISAYYWNGTTWIEYPTVRYPALNKIQFWTDHFSTYAVGLPMSARALAFNGSVQNIVAYPNPWRSDAPTAGRGAADEAYGIKLTNFPGGDVRIRIYTIAGELLQDANVNALTNVSTNPNLKITSIINTGAGTVSWNLANASGKQIASGVYLFVLEGPGGRAVRKVAVIR